MSIAQSKTAWGMTKPKCSPTLGFQGGVVAGPWRSVIPFLAFEAIEEVTDSGTLSSAGGGELVFGTETLLVTNSIVIVLSLVHVVKQQLVSDVLSTGEHGQQITLSVNGDLGLYGVVLLRDTPVSHCIQTVGSIELLHVHDVASDVDGPGVVLFLDQLLEHFRLLHAVGDASLTVILSALTVSNVALLSKSGSLGFLELGLLNFSQLDLAEGLLTGELSISALHLLLHLVHLTLLLSRQGCLNSLQLLLVSSQHHVNVLLVHILQEFFLLVSQLLSLEGILLLLELVHELHLLLLHLVLPVEHALLAVQETLHLSFFIGLHVVYLLLLVTVSLAFESIKFLLRVSNLLLEVGFD